MKKKIYQPNYILKRYAAYDVFSIPKTIRRMSQEELREAIAKQIREAKRICRNSRKKCPRIAEKGEKLAFFDGSL